MKQASASLKRVDAVAEAAEKGLEEVNAIAASIREGKGSLGKFVRDDEAYQKMMALSTHGSKAIDDLDQNLAALKRTWPLSRYFDDKGFYDRDRVLFKPGSERDSRTIPTDALFEPGRSVLTETGRKQLDDIAAWFEKAKRPKSEVVIVAFTDDDRDQDLAQILTQEQADAVRKYLVARHSIDSAGWFSARKVAAVGFGSQPPRSSPGDPGGDAPSSESRSFCSPLRRERPAGSWYLPSTHPTILLGHNVLVDDLQATLDASRGSGRQDARPAHRDRGRSGQLRLPSPTRKATRSASIATRSRKAETHPPAGSRRPSGPLTFSHPIPI